MNVSIVSPLQRSLLEFTLLNQHFPSMVKGPLTNRTLHYPDHVDLPMTTNSGKHYVVRLVIPAAYPDQMPDMLVIQPKPLKNRRGKPLLSLSAEMHVIGSEGGLHELMSFQLVFVGIQFLITHGRDERADVAGGI